MQLISSVPYYKMNGERLRLKANKEGEVTTYSGKVFQCDTVLGNRPVGSKFEMVRPYYSATRAHNVLGHAHFPATWNPSSRMLLLSNGHFEAAVRPNDSVAAVTLENEALLCAFFVFAAVMTLVFACDLL